MIILLKTLLALLLMIFILQRRIQIGHAIFAAALLMFFLTEPSAEHFLASLRGVALNIQSWNMFLTLYLIMCLEYILRTSGVLKDFIAETKKLFRSDRILIAFMPAFLGFLPSLGGAMFSAPMVQEISKPYNISPERKAAINYWFRHVWEFCNPILPALLLASALTQIPLNKIIGNQLIFSFFALSLGSLILLSGQSLRAAKEKDPAEADPSQIPKEQKHRHPLLLAAGPILANILLVTVLHIPAALAMAAVLTVLLLILHFSPIEIKTMLKRSLDFKIQWSIFSALFLQQILQNTGAVDELVLFFQSTDIAPSAVIGLIAFFLGLLTGMPQGFIAIAFPLIVPMAGTSSPLDIAAFAYLCGTTGSMLSPAHLCLVVSMEYYKTSFFSVLKFIAPAQLLLLSLGTLWLLFF